MTDVHGSYDVVVIGAGPSGAVASALLARKGYNVLVLEKAFFPRFSIGESLLPQSMEFIEQAGMLKAVVEAGFQFKNGAAFRCGELHDAFDFREKFSPGWGTTYQVPRAQFDKILADEAKRLGAEVVYGHTVTAFQDAGDKAVLSVLDTEGNSFDVSAKFVLDASGFGRVLPQLLDLELPSSLACRTSLFTHIEDRISDDSFDRNKILITVHPLHREVWYWLIPFSNGRSSVGVVAPREMLSDLKGDNRDKLTSLIAESGKLSELLSDAGFDTQVGLIDGYSCDVKTLYGKSFALLGNAGEFLDPVFSSGVTIALKSASLAAEVVDRELQSLQPDWDSEYAQPLKRGVNTFREFVQGWYDGRLQDVIFSTDKSAEIKEMISSILAGYAWDIDNPYVKDVNRLSTLAELCRR